MLTYCVGALLCALCSSCFTPRWVETAPQSLDARAKTFAAPADKANLYVIFLGNWSSVHAIFLDGKEVAVLDKRKYRLWEITPGEHVVAEGWSTPYQKVTLTAEAGQNYFVCVTQQGSVWVRQPWYTIERLGEKEGRELVGKLRLAGSFRSLSGEEHSYSK
jgi:hypothetical protein